MQHLAPILLTAVVLLTLDSLYIYSIGDLFTNTIKAVQHAPLRLNIGGAVACYILLITGVYYFLLLKRASLTQAFLLGLLVYGVYETTTLALLKRWPVKVAVLDTLWGATLFTLTTCVVRRFATIPKSL